MNGMNGRNGGMAGMAERQKEWQNGRMAEMATYILFMVHTNDDEDTDNDTLIFYITEEGKSRGACPMCKMALSYDPSVSSKFRFHVWYYLCWN